VQAAASAAVCQQHYCGCQLQMGLLMLRLLLQALQLPE
jgi:hypothetical protein